MKWSKIVTIFPTGRPRDEKSLRYSVLSVSHGSVTTARLEDRALTMPPDRPLVLRSRQARDQKNKRSGFEDFMQNNYKEINSSSRAMRIYSQKSSPLNTGLSSNIHRLVKTMFTTRWLKSDCLTAAVTALFIGVAETSRNITVRVIERDVSGPLHKFLEESRGFRTRQHGCQGHQIARQLDC
ncbi:hypothetical protein TNCV_5118431 [Trichonephila clavipes]|nr:hypothetical protein TNCV_5118431 [Trichonephila clavipes]